MNIIVPVALLVMTIGTILVVMLLTVAFFGLVKGIIIGILFIAACTAIGIYRDKRLRQTTKD